MNWKRWLEPCRAYWARKKLERLQYEAAARLFETRSGSQVVEDPDASRWRLLGGGNKDELVQDPAPLRDQARWLVDNNPYARQVLVQYRNYVIGTGMKQEVHWRPADVVDLCTAAQPLPSDQRRRRAQTLWQTFLHVNEWEHGQRKDWEWCWRTWRDGESFLQLFRQPVWPPRVHFVDPEWIAPDPQTGLPSAGIATAPGQVEVPTYYQIVHPELTEQVEAERMLHVKIGVDGNVKRGLTILQPVIESLKRFQGWLDVELIQRKVASSIVLVRKHQANTPGGLARFADAASTIGGGEEAPRKLTLQPGTIIDAQGFDLQFLSPNTHFDDASLLGRMILLSIAAGTGLPEFMLSADASNANYASTLIAEGPAVRHFAAWQSFFIGQWRKLFAMVMHEAVRLGLLDQADLAQLHLQITPPTLAVRQRLQDAQADAIYFDRGVVSWQELARRDQADPDQMRRERSQSPAPPPASGGAS